jgi:ATP-binding cassette subfamily B protein
VALVGPPAPKTTIFQLLMRFFDPDAGRVTLDWNRPARGRARRAAARMALVPQEPVIFATTARENIRFGRPEASDAEIEEAARAAAAHDFLRRLPQATTPTWASGGDAVGRAAPADRDRPRDPAGRADPAARRGTSSLDAESERAVQTAVDRLARGGPR